MYDLFLCKIQVSRSRLRASECIKNICFEISSAAPICMQRITIKHSRVSPGGFLGEASRAAAASVRPCRKISIRLVLPGNPAGIVKRKAGRDNSVGVERGFRRNGILAECPCLYIRGVARLRGVSRKKITGRFF